MYRFVYGAFFILLFVKLIQIQSYYYKLVKVILFKLGLSLILL